MKRLPRFEPMSISKYPIPEGLNIECGYLTVPESRSAASGGFPGDRTLRIYATIVKSLNENPAPDPIVFLYGGPGGNSGGMLRALESPDIQHLFLSQHDLIVFDQRGTGFSEPALFAPEVELALLDDFLKNLNADERAERHVAALLQARSRFVSDGINLAAVNTPEIVADMNDLRLALGYERVNLYGISYGTRPALVAMRDFPEGIRSVILDSTVPVQVSQYVEAIPNAQHAFDLLFDSVAADPKANAAYPDLKAVFHQVYERLDETPAPIPIEHPQTGEAISLRLTGEMFIGIFCMGFYSSEAITRMPDHIYQAYRGEYRELAETLTQILGHLDPGESRRSLGMYYSVNCCDDKVSAKTAKGITKHAKMHPVMSSLPLTEFHLGKYIADVGERWGARPAGPAEHKAVESDIPALILAGEFDQNTPSYWGQLVSETLRNSHYIEFPGTGHGVLGHGECAAAVISEFYDHPLRRPDDRCVRELPGISFVIPNRDLISNEFTNREVNHDNLTQTVHRT